MRAAPLRLLPRRPDDPGDNLPGQTVFTCLSHDIVAHETTHALLDGMHRHFTEPTNPDVPAFHEAFADIVALFQHFTYKDVLLDTIQRTGGLIYKPRLDPEVRSGDQPAITPELSESNPTGDAVWPLTPPSRRRPDAPAG